MTVASVAVAIDLPVAAFGRLPAHLQEHLANELFGARDRAVYITALPGVGVTAIRSTTHTNRLLDDRRFLAGLADLLAHGGDAQVVSWYRDHSGFGFDVVDAAELADTETTVLAGLRYDHEVVHNCTPRLRPYVHRPLGHLGFQTEQRYQGVSGRTLRNPSKLLAGMTWLAEQTLETAGEDAARYADRAHHPVRHPDTLLLAHLRAHAVAALRQAEVVRVFEAYRAAAGDQPLTVADLAAVVADAANDRRLDITRTARSRLQFVAGALLRQPT